VKGEQKSGAVVLRKSLDFYNIL